MEIGKRKNRKQITVHVDVNLWERFKRLCIEKHESYSDIINRMIRAVLESEESENDIEA